MSQELTKYSFDEDLEGEEWREVFGYEDLYLISNMGRVRSLDRTYVFKKVFKRSNKGRLLTPTLSPTGYFVLNLARSGKYKTRQVHQLVSESFLNHFSNKKMHVDHINGVRTDNRLSNLQVLSARDNAGKGLRCGWNQSGAKGVYTDRHRWRTEFWIDKRRLHLGSYGTVEEANKVYQTALKNMHLYTNHKEFKQLILNKYYEQSATKN